MVNNSYIVLTSAYNEENYLGAIIESMSKQVVLPLRWLILDDGSNDRTAVLAQDAAARNPFISVCSLPPRNVRTFQGKAEALRLGYETLHHLPFGYVGILDADVTLPPDYYEGLLKKFEADARLGLAGGVLHEESSKGFKLLKSNARWSVSGPIQMFRRSCWEEIGGYLPLARGGIDAVAEIMVRMRGWQVHAFTDLPAFHHRPIGTATGTLFGKNFRAGIKEYAYGMHPLFEVLKALHRATEPPFLISSFLRLAGFGWAWLRREPQPLPRGVMDFFRREQLERLDHYWDKVRSRRIHT